jgi:hypothetical protein
VEYGLQRLRASRVLQGCLVVAFMCYGGLSFLLVSGRLSEGPTAFGSPFHVAGGVTFLSLASWFFLLRWYPALESTKQATDAATLRDDRDRRWIPRALEIFAIGCVALVHVLMAIIVVYLARR